MLYTRVFSFSVLPNEDGINIVVGRFVAGDGLAGTNIGEEVEGSTKGKIERDVSFTDRCLNQC